jgi:hypothetical protein
MAILEHLNILEQGIEVWNKWRLENPSIEPDLSGADLSNHIFENANFSNTNFHRARMTQWQVIDCDFSGCNLTQISAQGSYWKKVKFWKAHLTGDLVLSTMYSADFTGAKIENCGLPDSEWRYIKLNHTKFSPHLPGISINSWSIIQSDLSGVGNPQSALHEYPSNVDFGTLKMTASGLIDKPERVKGISKFFFECGLPQEIISIFETWTRKLPDEGESSVAEGNYYSCFISYSHADRMFAQILYERLKTQGIHCWMDEKEILPGDDILDMIDGGIRKWDKVLLCCSKDSLTSPWVEREIEKALIKEEQLARARGSKTLVIIPLNLDDFLFEWESGKASILQMRFALDCKSWENDSDEFEIQMKRLLAALRADKLARTPIPEPRL